MNVFRTLSGKIKEYTKAEDDPFQQSVLGGLQPRPFPDGSNAKHVYAQTVSAGDKNRRRAKNRVARKSRQKNRRNK